VGIHDYLEAASHGDDEQGPLVRPIRNNRNGRIDKALVTEGRHRGAVRHVEKSRGLPRQNQLDLALQELGRIERTLFMLDWLESLELCRRCHAGLNKSEHRHFLAQVICTFKQDRIAHRSAEAQQFRASGLNLVIAAIVFWSATYIADAITHLRATEQSVPDAWLAHTSPLSWEHIGFSGDFLWRVAA
jgi:Tn3 transposase DDE domain